MLVSDPSMLLTNILRALDAELERLRKLRAIVAPLQSPVQPPAPRVTPENTPASIPAPPGSFAALIRAAEREIAS